MLRGRGNDRVREVMTGGQVITGLGVITVGRFQPELRLVVTEARRDSPHPRRWPRGVVLPLQDG